MTDDEFLSLAYTPMFGDMLDREHEAKDRPAEVVLLHRSFPTYTESMWITGYPAIRAIVVSCPEVRVPASAAVPVEHVFPGAVRELPVGWRDMRSAETFRAKFAQVVESYEGMGWTRKDPSVRTGEVH
jgi:hypothetical protein